MGADMLVSVCSHPRNVGLADEDAPQALYRWAANLDRHGADRFFLTVGGDGLDAMYQDREDPGSLEALGNAHKDDPALAWAQRFLGKYANDSWREVSATRAVTTITLGGQLWFIAGGMSWGEEVKCSRELGLLDMTGVFNNKAFCGCLDLSTDHIPKRILASSFRPGFRLSAQNLLSLNFGVIRVEEHGFGWMVFLGDKQEDGKAAAWAQPILKMARKTGCRFINFDRDGERSPWLVDFTQGTSLEQLRGAHDE